MDPKGPQITKIILKKMKVGGIKLFDFKICHKAKVIKTI